MIDQARPIDDHDATGRDRETGLSGPQPNPPRDTDLPGLRIAVNDELTALEKVLPQAHARHYGRAAGWR